MKNDQYYIPIISNDIILCNIFIFFNYIMTDLYADVNATIVPIKVKSLFISEEPTKESINSFLYTSSSLDKIVRLSKTSYEAKTINVKERGRNTYI